MKNISSLVAVAFLLATPVASALDDADVDFSTDLELETTNPERVEPIDYVSPKSRIRARYQRQSDAGQDLRRIRAYRNTTETNNLSRFQQRRARLDQLQEVQGENDINAEQKLRLLQNPDSVKEAVEKQRARREMSREELKEKRQERVGEWNERYEEAGPRQNLRMDVRKTQSQERRSTRWGNRADRAEENGNTERAERMQQRADTLEERAEMNREKLEERKEMWEEKHEGEEWPPRPMGPRYQGDSMGKERPSIRRSMTDDTIRRNAPVRRSYRFDTRASQRGGDVSAEEEGETTETE